MKPRQVTVDDYNFKMTDRERAEVAQLVNDAGLDVMYVAHIEIRDTDTVFTVEMRKGESCEGSYRDHHTGVYYRSVVYP